ncbi:MAG: type II secretion system protein, partial [Candidatus Pacebacteria bacterium]|nr:type II secretion system protein [Candidatus Paceibacterota bacterium]
MLEYYKKIKSSLKGYTLIEVMVAIAIYAIMAVVIFSSGPNLGRAISFNNEANLIADTIRDLQIKGSSAFTGRLQSNTTATTTNSATSTNVVGIGMSFFATTSTSKVAANTVNNVKLFYVSGNTLNQYGAYSTPTPYDPAFCI